MFLKNTHTGSMFRVLGSLEGPDAGVWLRKIGDIHGTGLPWREASMRNSYHRYVAVDEHGNEQERQS